MTGPIRTRGEERNRRRIVHEHLISNGYAPRFIELMILRLRRHDELRRARAVVQALNGYRDVIAP